MDEEQRRPLALLLVEELDRSLGRPEPCVGPVERIAGAEPAGAERERNGCKAERRLQLTLGHAPLRPAVPAVLTKNRALAASRAALRESVAETLKPRSFCTCTLLRPEAAIGLVNQE